MDDHSKSPRKQPLGALVVEANGFTVWTAETHEELGKLRAIVERISVARTAAGLEPVSRVTDATPVAAAPGVVRAILTYRIPADALIWIVDSKDQTTMAAVRDAGLFGDHPIVVGASGRGKTRPELDDRGKVLGGEDYEGRAERLDTALVRAEAVEQLGAARDALVAALPNDLALRAALAGDLLDDPNVITALNVVAAKSDTRLIAAVLALKWAINYAGKGSFKDAQVWAARTVEALKPSVLDEYPPSPAVADAVNTDQVILVWVDGDDEPHTGTIDRLAVHLDHVGLGDAPEVRAVYAAQNGELVRVITTIRQTDYDREGDGFATGHVTVTLPDRSEIVGTWHIDGNA